MAATVLTQAKRRAYNAQLAAVEQAQAKSASSVYLSAAYAFQNDYPFDGIARMHLARAFFMEERFEEAMHHAEAAHKILPQNEATNILLVRIYLHFRLFEFAAPIVRAAQKNHPDSAFIHWAVAEYHMAAQNGTKARLHYAHALKHLKDDYFLNLLKEDYADCLASIGEKKIADQVYSEIQSIPDRTVHTLVNRASLGLHDLNSGIGKQINLLLEKPELEAHERASLLLALGNILDSAGDHHKAFELWTESRSLLTKAFVDNVSKSADEAVSFYSKEFLQDVRPYGHASAKPLFIVGMPRSGTTLAEQIMASHTEVGSLGEIGRMVDMNNHFVDIRKREDYEDHIRSNAKAGELIARGDEYLRLIDELLPATHRYVVDKMPSQYISLGYAFMCFPNAKVIHCQRHPADSFVSSFQSSLNNYHAYSRSQKSYAEAYLTKEKAMNHWRSIYPDNIFQLHYEDLVANPREVVESLLAFLGLEWQDACLEFFKNDKPIQTLSQHQVKQPIYTSSVARWKRYEPFLGELFEHLKAGGLRF